MDESRKFRTLFLFERIHKEAIDLLSTVSEIRLPSDSTEETVLTEIREADALVIRSGEATARLMDAAPKLAVIARHGAGVETVDIEAATERQIYVVNAPDSNFRSVAEHTVCLMIALAKYIVFSDGAVRRGEWNVRHTHIGREMHGKTVGIIGFGRIGQCVARICRGGFGTEVLYYDIIEYPREAEEIGARKVALEELLRESDFVSLHIPLSPDTKGLIGERELTMMKPTAFLLNMGRGPVVKDEPLLKALKEGVIAGAGLDVFDVEPPPIDSPLYELDNVILSPHTGGLTEEAMRRMGLSIVQDIMRVWEGATPKYWVNRWE